MSDDRQIDFRALAEFRYQIRKFVRFSEDAARGAGVEPHQYQVLLSIKGLPESELPTVRVLAERMQVRHHSAVEMIDRLESAGLVTRRRSGEDRRQVLVQITAKGERILRDLAAYHQDELRNTGPALAQTLRRLIAREPGSMRTERSGKATGRAG